MKRTALFLKDAQAKKLQTLSEKTGAPVANSFAGRLINILRRELRN
jgi:hypothetical protein